MCVRPALLARFALVDPRLFVQQDLTNLPVVKALAHPVLLDPTAHWVQHQPLAALRVLFQQFPPKRLVTAQLVPKVAIVVVVYKLPVLLARINPQQVRLSACLVWLGLTALLVHLH